MAHIDTSDPTRNRFNLGYQATPILFSIIHISGLVIIDTFDPTRNRADLVCHATQSPWRIYIRPTQHITVLTLSVMPPQIL